MSRFLRRLVLLLIVLAAAGAWAWEARPWEEKPVAVKLATLAAAPASEVLAVNGQLIPGEKVDLGAQVAGQVAAVLVEAGDTVTRGQILARLDDSIARSTLAQAEASLKSARIDAESARRANERAQALGSNVSAQARDAARAAQQTAEARVAELEAAVEQARQKLALTQVRAPIDGTVLDVTADKGAGVSTTTTLFTIGDLTRPRIETDVDETYGARIHVGLAARVAPVGSQQGMPATVSFVAPVVNPDTGGRTIRLTFDTPPADPLPSGLTMSVNIVVDSFDNAISVPRSAVRDLDSAPYVLLDRAGRAAKVPVTLRRWPADSLIVTHGLAAGDALIEDPQGIDPGALVTAAAR